jgi:hypothetical protein
MAKRHCLENTRDVNSLQAYALFSRCYTAIIVTRFEIFGPEGVFQTILQDLLFTG